MKTILTDNRESMGRLVAKMAAEELRAAIATRGRANLVIATGSSQFEVLEQLRQQPEIDWTVVDGFHLDEYVGLSTEHLASFCKYLKERFVDKVPLGSFHYLSGDRPASEVVAEASRRIMQHPIDVALVGIGENGHLAFNDPPADFDTEKPYLIVELDEPCRRQQVGEGWFDDLASVPEQAISMSVRQILKSECIFCSVPDERKAAAVASTLQQPVSPEVPASILRNHHKTTLVIDRAAASELSDGTRDSLEIES